VPISTIVERFMLKFNWTSLHKGLVPLMAGCAFLGQRIGWRPALWFSFSRVSRCSWPITTSRCFFTDLNTDQNCQRIETLFRVPSGAKRRSLSWKSVQETNRKRKPGVESSRDLWLFYTTVLQEQTEVRVQSDPRKSPPALDFWHSITIKCLHLSSYELKRKMPFHFGNLKTIRGYGECKALRQRGHTFYNYT